VLNVNFSLGRKSWHVKYSEMPFSLFRINSVKLAYISSSMNCLTCNDPMVALELDGLEIDYCFGCSGIWLDAGELENLAGGAMSFQLVNAEGNRRRSKRRCPICGKRMELRETLGTKHTELDACRLGHGIWFDRGELQDVLSSLERPVRDAVVKQLNAIFAQTR
jgi:Zn-finger nucleic acid-binding protein